MNPISLPISPTNSASTSDEEQVLIGLPHDDVKFLGMAPFVQVQEGYNDQLWQARLKAVGLMIMLLGLGGSGVLLGRALDTRPLTGDLLKLFCQMENEGEPNVLVCNVLKISDALHPLKVALLAGAIAVPVGVAYVSGLHVYSPSHSSKIVVEEAIGSNNNPLYTQKPLQIDVDESSSKLGENTALVLSEGGGGEPGASKLKAFAMFMALPLAYASGMMGGVAGHLFEIGQNFEKYCEPYNSFNKTNGTEVLCNITKTPEVIPGVPENARTLYVIVGG